jgi:dTDP-4-amino-4,6-dideoxygalactose transaminase
MALEACGIGPGDEVIVPAISFISTASAVSRVGATPVFADIEPLTFNLDPDRAAAAVSARTRAILAVHFGGPMADMDRLPSLARERGLLLLEDAAHAHGSEWNGRRAGSFGLAGSFSFQNSKVMTAGEGGILIGNDRDLIERAWSIANCGRRREGGWFHHFSLGSNYRLSAWQAAVLVAQLERLPEQIARRARNAALLRRELADVAELRFQQPPEPASVHSHYLLLGRIGAARDEFQRELVARGVPCTPFYPHALYGNPMYARGGCRAEPCPVAEECVRDAFWLPCRALMGDQETTLEIAAAIRAAVQSSICSAR